MEMRADLQGETQGEAVCQAGDVGHGVLGGQAAPAWNLNGTHLDASWQQHGPPACRSTIGYTQIAEAD